MTEEQKIMLFDISTHSLTRRLTMIELLVTSSVPYFNSQPHKEADVEYPIAEIYPSLDFNSQPHKEADKSEMIIPPYLITFQLTASQGG